MAVRNLEIRKEGKKYIFLEQAGSNYRKDLPVHEASDREEAEAWLAGEGGDPGLAGKVLDEAGTAERVFFEIPGGDRESEEFPKQ